MSRKLDPNAILKRATYLGELEFKDESGEWRVFTVLKTKKLLIFGSPTNNMFLVDGYLVRDVPYESLDESLQELLADLECYFNDSPRAVSRITVYGDMR